MQLSILDICKTYASGVKALDHVELDISVGMFGLLGPNGAGKSTLMRTIATLQSPDSGSILFNNSNIFKDKTNFRNQLGYLPQEFGVYPKDSAIQLLNYFAILKGITSRKERKSIVSKVLTLTNLTEYAKKRVSSYSGGMKRRFGIAQVLLNDPKVIIVDEPTAGLDPAERSRFLNILRQISTDKIVIFSTHLVEDVSDLCQDMAIISKGSVHAKIAPKVAIKQLQGKIWETATPDTTKSSLKKVVELSQHFNNTGHKLYRMYSEIRPNVKCAPVSARLEDFYFLTLQGGHS